MNNSAIQNYPLQTYVGQVNETVRPASDYRQWFPMDLPEAYEEYLKRDGLDKIPEKYRLDDDWGYHFNQARYRGEEFDFNAKRRIAVCGCSNTFGVGIKWEQTFAYQFKRRYAEHHGLAEDEVNLLNFAEGGASNDYIARTMLTQCSSFKPDLVLINFTFQTRKEYVTDERIEAVGPWTDQDPPHEPSLDYFAWFTNEMGFINSVRNILLVQQFCQVHQIPYLFAWFDHRHLDAPEYMNNPVCSAYAKQLDRSRLADFNLQFDHTDVARDNYHPGPKSNEEFAERFFDLYTQVVEN